MAGLGLKIRLRVERLCGSGVLKAQLRWFAAGKAANVAFSTSANKCVEGREPCTDSMRPSHGEEKKATVRQPLRKSEIEKEACYKK